jgi:hypothetical protein
MPNVNSCYKPGAIWVTRSSVIASPVVEDTTLSADTVFSKNDIDDIMAWQEETCHVPPKSIITLLAYYMDYNKREHIQFLYEQKCLFAFHVDTGSMFHTNPNNINTQDRVYKSLL